MSKYASLVAKKVVPQSAPLDARQVQNNASGFVFAITDWERLNRFLVLGSDASTYYQKAQALTRANAECVQRCYDKDALKTVSTIVAVSHEGRAPKNDASIFALAMGAAHPEVRVRQLALAALNKVCRTSTHLFQFVENMNALGKGWSRATRRAVSEWYDDKSLQQVAYQAIKYRSRGNFTHKRLLETARPLASLDKDNVDARTALYKWMKGKLTEPVAPQLLPLIAAHEQAMVPGLPKKELIKLIKEHRLPWEAVPTDVTKDPDVWSAMLPELGLTALIRNLGAMTSYGTLKPLGSDAALVVKRLGDEEQLKKARVHPFQLLLALTAYKDGSSIAARQYGKTGLSWSPVGNISAALDKAFYATFKTIQPTGKRHLLALDVSGSMTSPLMGSHLSCRDATAALALVTMATEPQTHVVGFTSAGHANRLYGGRWGGGGAELTELPITAGMRLDEAVRAVDNLPFGGTDCALPMIYALKKKLEVDVFVVYTDNETWAGDIHPMEALKDYRKKMGINAKLVVVGMTATEFSIADPNDGGALDVVGFDASAPAVIADFVRR